MLIIRLILLATGLLIAGVVGASDDAARIETLIDEEYAKRNNGVVLEGGTRLRNSSASSAPSSAAPVMDDPVITVSSDIPLNELSNHLGQSVSISLQGKRKYRGVIDRVSGDKVFLTIKQNGGEAVMPVSRTQIVKVERF